MEFSLYDRNGAVAFSSVPEAVGREMPAGQKEQMIGRSEMLLTERDEAIEIFQPHIVVGDCIRCHTTWNEGEVCGVSYFNFSREALKLAENQASLALQDFSRSNLRFAVAGVVAIVVIFVLGMYFTVRRFVSRPLSMVVQMLKKYDVDLTLEMPITTRDEIGAMARLLNRFVNKLNRVIGHAQQVADEVGDEAGRQAASVEETTTAMEQMASMTKQNAENSSDASRLMGDVAQGVGQADETIGSLVDSMQELTGASHEVAKIIKTINEIASKTNLLSLNAAVEAARAGEAGVGFAVVADEVRSLAQHSAQSARDTATLIETIIDRIQTSAQMVQASGKAFNQLKEQIGQANQLVEGIANSSAEQAIGIEQMNVSLMEIDRGIQQNSAQANLLTETMSTFQTDHTKK